ncbi:MAG: type II secretion system protein [Bacilli bacterium]|nr:type II secretion system protein [Bacilli bacterium]
MKKKGFTLIELLAVIVILGILALVAIPIINGIIYNTKKSAFQESINLVLDSASNYISKYSLNHGYVPTYPISLVCDGVSCSTKSGDSLELGGEIPIGGRVYITREDDIYSDALSNGTWCASGYIGNLEITDSCAKLDDTPPKINGDIDDVDIRTSSNRVIVIIPKGTMEDPETGIRYIVKLYKGLVLLKTEEIINPTDDVSVAFNDLDSNTEYTIEVTGQNGTLLSETLGSKTVKTSTITAPILTFTTEPTPPLDNWVRSQTANVKYIDDNIDEDLVERYVMSTRTGLVVSGKILGSCGTGLKPNNSCNVNGNYTNLVANTWYKVEDDISIVYSNYSNEINRLIAYISDGHNKILSSELEILKVDDSNPSIMEQSRSIYTERIQIDYGISGNYYDTNKITCKYGEEENNYTRNALYPTNEKCILTGLETSKTYYYQICVIDKLGESTCTEGSATTKDFIMPILGQIEGTLEYSRGHTDGWINKEGILVDFKTENKNNISVPEYYIYSEKQATITSGTIQKSCGNEPDYPNNCISVVGSTVEVGTWYKVNVDSNTTITLKYDTTDDSEDKKVFAYISDGRQGKKSGGFTILKIDSEIPKITNVQISGSTATINATDKFSGVKLYCVLQSYDISGCTGQNTWQQSQTFTNLSAGEYYAYVVDKAGNTSLAKSFKVD